MSENHSNNPSPPPPDGEQRQLSRRGLLKLSFVGGGALLMGPGFLAACSSDTGGTSSSNTTSAAGGGSTTAAGSSTAGGSTGGGTSSSGTAAPSSTSGGGGGGGGSITVGVVDDIANFDPYNDVGENFIILENLNTQMIFYDDKLQASPGALTKWEMSSDKSQITLTLRDDLKLQTGKVWNADDLVQGFKRAQDAEEGQQLNGPMAIVKDYKKTDDHTVVMTFTTPVAEGTVTDLLEMFPAMDSANNNSAYLATKPASGGPFQLKARDPGNTVTASRFPDYWNASNVFLDEVQFKIFGDSNSMVAALQSGDVDVIVNFPPTNAAQLKDEFTILQGFPGALVDCLRFNIFKPPYDKIEMRQAIARAIDRERIVKEVYFGYSQPLYLPWGPNSPATDPAYAQSQSYDLDAAKALWEKAGSPKGGEAMILGSSSTQVQMMQIIQQSLQQIGFQVDIEPVDAATNTKRYYDLDFGMTFNGLGNTSKNDPTRITTNSIFRTEQNVILKDKVPQEYIDGIAAARKALTPEAQKAAYDTLNKVITTQAFAISIDVIPYLFAHKKSLTGVGRTADNWLVLEGAKKTS